MKSKKTTWLVMTAVCAALICVFAPLSVPLPGNPVPVTLATFALYLIAACAGTARSVTATAVYLCLGAMGIPVFSGFRGGVGILAGPTGGYLAGYLLLVLITAVVADRFETKPWVWPAGMVLGTVILYAFGTAWFMIYTKNTFAASLSMCVVPFLIGDAVKIAAASLISPRLHKAIRSIEQPGGNKNA